MDGGRRQRGACSWAMRVPWPSRPPRRRPGPQGRPPRPWPPRGRGGPPAGVPGRRLRTTSRAAGAAVHAPGGLLRSARAAAPPPAGRAAHGGAGQPRRPRHHGRRALGWGWRGWCSPPPEEAQGGRGRATTGRAEGGRDADMLHASQDHKTPGDPGCRGRQPPAAIAPGWLEKPARRAAWARRPVVGWLLSRGIQRQVRLSLRTQDQPLPGNPGRTAPPMATGVVAWGAHVARSPCAMGAQEIEQVSGIPPPHLLLWDALGLGPSWDAMPATPGLSCCRKRERSTSGRFWRNGSSPLFLRS
jgi:hypothetical protein